MQSEMMRAWTKVNEEREILLEREYNKMNAERESDNTEKTRDARTQSIHTAVPLTFIDDLEQRECR